MGMQAPAELPQTAHSSGNTKITVHAHNVCSDPLVLFAACADARLAACALRALCQDTLVSCWTDLSQCTLAQLVDVLAFDSGCHPSHFDLYWGDEQLTCHEDQDAMNQTLEQIGLHAGPDGLLQLR